MKNNIKIPAAMLRKAAEQYLRQTMGSAYTLQVRYDNLGASGRQAIRNPIPLHKLIAGALPSTPQKAMTAADVTSALISKGFIARQSTVYCTLCQCVYKYGIKKTYRQRFAGGNVLTHYYLPT